MGNMMMGCESKECPMKRVRGRWPLAGAVSAAILLAGVIYYWWFYWNGVDREERIITFPFVVLAVGLAIASIVGGIYIWRKDADIALLPYALAVLVIVFVEIICLFGTSGHHVPGI